jgi:hypothetical protein
MLGQHPFKPRGGAQKRVGAELDKPGPDERLIA